MYWKIDHQWPLSIYLLIYLSHNLSYNLSIYFSDYLYVCLSILGVEDQVGGHGPGQPPGHPGHQVPGIQANNERNNNDGKGNYDIPIYQKTFITTFNTNFLLQNNL